MASAAAEKYFASFSPTEQQTIRDSWGGADLMDEWFKNAVTAGAVDSTGNRGENRQGSFGGSYAQGGYSGYSTNVTGASGVQAGQTPTPSQLRQLAKEQGWSEDFDRFSDAQLQVWLSESWDPSTMRFRNDAGDVVEKPTEGGAQSQAQGWATGEASSSGGGGGGGGGYGGGGGGGSYSGATTGFGGAPAFQYTPFTPPLPGDTTTDPSYQFRLQEGQDALERSASARGVLRTSGTLKDILDYGQNAASQEYQNIYDRGLSTWGAQYQGQKDAFAPQYGSWSTVYGGDLSKYLQRENNIYGLLNQPAPTPPYYG